jgi:hypothetical protein
MFGTLKHFRFNESFISWVKTLYSDIQTCVMNNGWMSENFKNSRGIRQGCPLSALLFVLSVEIMALNLRSCKDIKRITVKLDEKNHSIKISQLADDTTLFCNSKEDVLKEMNEIEIFGSFSGLLLNRNKAEGVWIGKLICPVTSLLTQVAFRAMKYLLILIISNPPLSCEFIIKFLLTLSGLQFHINLKYFFCISL